MNRQHGAAYAAFQAAQQTSADDTDRSGQDGAALHPNVSAALRPGKTEKQRESSDTGGGTEVGGLSVAVDRGQTHFLVVTARPAPPRAKSFSARACQVSPLTRLGAKAQALDALVDKCKAVWSTGQTVRVRKTKGPRSTIPRRERCHEGFFLKAAWAFHRSNEHSQAASNKRVYGPSYINP